MIPRTLFDWVSLWCSQPHKYLVTTGGQGRPDLHNLLPLMWGFLSWDSWQESGEEWRQFTLWLGDRHPELFQEGLAWFGHGLVIQCGGDHVKAAEHMRAYVEEYQSLPEAERKVSPALPAPETIPRTLFDWVIRWCSLPYMFLVTPSGHGLPHLDNLKLYLEGIMLGDPRQQAREEWQHFERWLASRRPELFREELTWFGEGLVRECNGDHAEAALRLKDYVEEYCALPGSPRGHP